MWCMWQVFSWEFAFYPEILVWQMVRDVKSIWSRDFFPLMSFCSRKFLRSIKAISKWFSLTFHIRCYKVSKVFARVDAREWKSKFCLLMWWKPEKCNLMMKNISFNICFTSHEISFHLNYKTRKSIIWNISQPGSPALAKSGLSIISTDEDHSSVHCFFVNGRHFGGCTHREWRTSLAVMRTSW